MANIKTSESYKIGDLLMKYTKTGIPVFQWFLKRYKNLPYLLFDIDEYQDPRTGKSKILFKFKSISGVTQQTTEDGQSVKWWEQRWSPIELQVDGDQTSVNTITVKSYNGYTINDLHVDDVVVIYSSADNTDYTRRITAIDVSGGKITIEGTAISVNDGDIIQFAYNTKGVGDTIDKTFNVRDYDVYQSYFQYVTAKIAFTVEELNKTYQFPTSVQEYVDARLKNTFNRIMEELAKIIWLGRNVSPSEGKPETLGIIKGIEKMGEELGDSTKFITSLASYTSYDDKVNAFLDVLNEAFDSGVYENGTITVVGTSKALFNLMKTNGAWYKLTGTTIMDSPNDPIKLGIKRLETGKGFSIEFMVDPILDNIMKNSKKYSDSVFVVLPRSRIALYQRPYDGVEDISGRLAKVGPGLSFRNLSEVTNLDKVARPSEFVAEGHFATILAGLRYGAYRIVYGY